MEFTADTIIKTVNREGVVWVGNVGDALCQATNHDEGRAAYNTIAQHRDVGISIDHVAHGITRRQLEFILGAEVAAAYNENVALHNRSGRVETVAALREGLTRAEWDEVSGELEAGIQGYPKVVHIDGAYGITVHMYRGRH